MKTRECIDKQNDEFLHEYMTELFSKPQNMPPLKYCPPQDITPKGKYMIEQQIKQEKEKLQQVINLQKQKLEFIKKYGYMASYQALPCNEWYQKYLNIYPYMEDSTK